MTTDLVRGIPVGPEMSHALGHIALENLDCALVSKHGGHYLR